MGTTGSGHGGSGGWGRRLRVLVAGAGACLAIAAPIAVGAGTTTHGETFGGSNSNDVRTGGAGDDHFSGGAGNDYFRGAAGNDTLDGGPDADVLLGDEPSTSGDDVLTGGDGGDIVGGGRGNDIESGGNGNDTLGSVDLTKSGGPLLIDYGNDHISGGPGDDVIQAGPGDDIASGDAGDDVLAGGPGNDTLSGGPGNDLLIGGDGTDTADYSASATAVDANLTTQTATGEGIDQLIGTENLTGSAQGDTLTGNGQANSIDGGAGNDVINVRDSKANDVVTCGPGYDTVYADPGDQIASDCENVNPDTTPPGGGTTDPGTGTGGTGATGAGPTGTGNTGAGNTGTGTTGTGSTGTGNPTTGKPDHSHAAKCKKVRKGHKWVKKCRKKKHRSHHPRVRASFHDTACGDPSVSQAVLEVTGNTAFGKVCNVGLYNNGVWDSYASLKAAVQGVIQVCGSDSSHMNLVQALLENTGVSPSSGTSSLCHLSDYEQYIHDSTSPPYTGSVNWTSYDGGTYPATNALTAVQQTLQTCSNGLISEAIIDTTDHYPHAPAVTTPVRGEFFGNGSRGQCNRSLYGSGELSNYDSVRQAVSSWAAASGTCTNPDITTAIRDMTGWNPRASGTGGDCDPSRYGYGSWTDTNELRKLVVSSFRCSDPWIGEAWVFVTGSDSAHEAGARGDGATGECNPGLIGQGDQGNGTVIAPVSYDDTKTKVTALYNNMTGAQLSLDRHGSATLTTNGQTLFYPPEEVRIGNESTTRGVTTGLGDALTIGPSLLEAVKNGQVVGVGAGNVVGVGAGNVVGVGAGNVVGVGAGNLISDHGAGVVGVGAGGILPGDHAQILSDAGAELNRPNASWGAGGLAADAFAGFGNQ